MKIGIDFYSYHRYFGEIYDNQKDPGRRITFKEALRDATRLGIDGVTLETCFFDRQDDDYLKELKEILDIGNMEGIVSWGHPAGLEGGENKEALIDMERHFNTCDIMGTNILRIVGSHYGLRNTPHRPQMEKLIKILKDPVKRAEDRGIILAMENHFDFTCDEMLEIFESISSKNFGMTMDTGNAYRYGDDPVKAAKKLAKYIHTLHFKDVAPLAGGNPEDWFYLACTAIGQGELDIPGLCKTLIESGFDGLFAVEFDYLHPKHKDEYAAMDESLIYLRSLNL